MKQLIRLILACAALATCAVAGAQTYDSAADRERRDRNREEALAKYRALQDRPADRSTRAGERAAAGGGPTLGDRARSAGKSVRNFTHRQAEKARDFSERQDRKWEKRGYPKSSARNRNQSRGTPD